MYNAFVGTFDGLGHTIDNMFVDPVGLLGSYNKEQGTLLKDVKFTNLRASAYAYKKPYDGTAESLSALLKYQALIATISYTDVDSNIRKDIPAENQIKLENVVIEIATSGHRTDVAGYLGSSANYYWSFFRGNRAVTFNEDGTYKSSTNYADTQRSHNKVAMDGVVLKYLTPNNVAYNSPSYYGGIIFSYGDQGVNYAAALAPAYYLSSLKNVYVISAPSSYGKLAVMEAQRTDSAKTTYIGLAQNDFYSLGFSYYEGTYYNRPYVATVNIGNYGSVSAAATSGIGYITTTNEDGSTTVRAVYASNIDTYGTADSTEYVLAENETIAIHNHGVTATTYTAFYAAPFYRYNDYAAAVNAGVTQVGNFAITADGIVWSPAN